MFRFPSPARPLHLLSILLLGFVVLLGAGHASGQTRYLGWNDTGAGDETRNVSPNCDILPLSHRLVASFQAPAECTEVARLTAEIDFCTAPADLPDWWRFDDPASCRYQAASVSAYFGSGPDTWEDPWLEGGAISATVEFTSGWNGNDVVGHAFVTVTPQTPVTLVAGEHYYAFQLVFDNTAGSCEGCDTPTCFVLNSLAVFGPDDTEGCWTEPTGDVTLENYTNYASWQGAILGCPFIVPVQATTWGGIKALYR